MLDTIVTRLGFPVFVKPANLGSSVGISKAKHAAELRTAIELAAQFDRKIVVEAAVPHAREIEVAVLGNDDPEASVPGEIIPSREFYDYEAKYVSDDSRTVIPADIDEARAAEVRALAIAAFKAIDGAGMARVDFLLAGDSQVALSERSEHHPRLHDDQHVLEDVGRERSAVRAAARSSHRARDRTARGETVAAHEHVKRIAPTFF